MTTELLMKTVSEALPWFASEPLTDDQDQTEQEGDRKQKYVEKCVFDSMLGDGHLWMNFDSYAHTMELVYTLFGVMHLLALLGYIAISVFTVWRKERLTVF